MTPVAPAAVVAVMSSRSPDRHRTKYVVAAPLAAASATRTSPSASTATVWLSPLVTWVPSIDSRTPEPAVAVRVIVSLAAQPML